MVQILVVRVDIGVVIYNAMTLPVLEFSGSDPGCQGGNRSGDLCCSDIPVWEVSGSDSGFQCGNRRVIYTAMASQCPRSVVQVLFIRVNQNQNVLFDNETV